MKIRNSYAIRILASAAISAAASLPVRAADTIYDDGAAHAYTGGGTFDLRPGNLIVGNTVPNTSLSINSSTDVLSDSGIIGNFAAADNSSVLVTGGSTWSSTSTAVFDVGRSGDGNTLTIDSAGAVTNAGDARLGANSSFNIATVTGSGSQCAITGGFYMADFGGTGNELRIQNSGSFSAALAYIGNSQGGNALSIQSGGQFTTAGFVTMGNIAASTGNVITVTGTNSKLQLTGAVALTIGNSGGSSTVTVSAGGLIQTGGDINLGHNSGHNIATVTGTSSQLTSTGGLYMGNFAGTGNELHIQNGGSVSSALLIVGNSQGGNSATIESGGQFTTSGPVTMGNIAGANGNALTVTGTNSKLLMTGASTFVIGNLGTTNTLDIEAGGLVQNGGDVYLGNNSSNNIATVTGAGSQWNSTTGTIYLSSSGGTGNELNVSDSGSVSFAGITVGNTAGSNSLSIDGGGTVAVSTMIVGSLASASGNAIEISGAGSSLLINGAGGSLTIGSSGSGNSVTISDGALLQNNGNPRIGNVGHNNVVTVTGAGSQWISQGGLGVSDNTGATGNQLKVEDGGSVATLGALIGFQPNSSASVTIDGPGSIFKSTIVGGGVHTGGPSGSGAGSISVTDGGTLQFDLLRTWAGPGVNAITNNGGVYQFTTAAPTITANAPGDITLNSGAVSYLNVSGANINNPQVANIARSGNNTFRLDNSSGASIASYTFEANTSNYQKLELRNGGVWNGINLTIGAGGALAGNGSVNASTSVSSTGSVSPGLSIGTINITGGLVLNGTYNVEAIVEDQITDVADLLIVNGSVDVSGATLNVVTLTNYGASLSKDLVIIQNDGVDAVVGIFGTLISNPSVQFTIDYAYAGPGGDGNDVAIHFTQVPEPAAGMMVMAFAGMALFTRKNRG